MLNGVYHHLKEGTSFDITYPILYANEAVAVNKTTTNTYDILHITITTTQEISMTAYLPVFIKGTLSGTIFTPDSTTPLTQTVPSEADNKYYILLGVASAATTLYLTEVHKIFAYKNGVFGEIANVGDAATVNGHTVNTDVPSNAVFTDTKVRQTLATGNNNRPLLMAYSNNTATASDIDNVVYRNNSIYANPSTGVITAGEFNGNATGCWQQLTTYDGYLPLLMACQPTTETTDVVKGQTLRNNDICANPTTGTISSNGFYDETLDEYASNTVRVNKISNPVNPVYDNYRPILFDSSDTSAGDGTRKVNAHNDLFYNPFVGSFTAPYFYGQQYAWQENYTDNGYECKRIYLWAARMGSGDSTLHDRKEVRFVHQIMYNVPITLTSTWGNSYYRSNIFKIKVPICEDIIGMTVSAQSNNKFVIANLSGVNASTGEVAIWFWGPKEEATAFNVHIHLSYACRYATVYGESS